jgi:ATP-binding cassette subfamily B multidrug efflux pump
MESIKWISNYIKKYKIKFIIALMFVLVSSALNMINPYLSGKIVEEVIVKKHKELLLPILGVMILVTVVKSMIRYFYQISFENISQNIVYEIRDSMYIKLQSLDFQYYNENRTGDLMSRMTGDMEAIRHFIAWVIYNIFENLTIFVFAVCFMFYINWKFTLIMISITPIIGYFAYKMTWEVGPTFFNIREQLSKLNTVVQENISGNRVVKSFAKEDYEVEKFNKENEEFFNANLISAGIWEKYLPILESLAALLSVQMILFGGIMVINNSMTLGQLVVFNSLIWALNNPMRMAGWLINDIQRFIASSKKIRLLLNAEPKIQNNDKDLKCKTIKGEIEFKGVGFSFDNEEILQDINFKVKPGETIGIIGPTGSGKSTLINLIERFYDATCGEILIDGKNIKDYDFRLVRDNIAVAMQEVFLFSDTVKSNISYGVKGVEFEEIVKASKLACADDFILKMTEGYDTIVGERGVGLSGGQKQRIALARAIIKDTPILVLDDTTSSLDTETEFFIQKNLKDICTEKTCIIIANRIASVKSADLILVIKDGKVDEMGTHEELLLKEGYYSSVYQNQWGNFNMHLEKEVM